MAHRIELKGKAKTVAAVVALAFLAWYLFGQTLFTFNFGYFNRGYQVSLFRAGHFEKSGSYWRQQNRTLGRIVSAGGETLLVDLDLEISRGTLVVFAWRWPGFLYGEPMLRRARFSADANERLEVPLTEPGVYMLSVSGINFRGDVAIDWRIADEP